MTAQLITLATTINDARIAANAIEAAAPQSGVYGDLAEALKKCLELLVELAQVETVYQSLLDGATVEQAIEYAGVEVREVPEGTWFTYPGRAVSQFIPND